MHKQGMSEARLVAQLAQDTDGIPEGAPCCAWCAGVVMACEMPLATPAELLGQGKGCPISLVAYSVAREHMKGRNVEVIPNPLGGAPYVRVDGKGMNPLKHYDVEKCGCPAEAGQ